MFFCVNFSVAIRKNSFKKLFYFIYEFFKKKTLGCVLFSFDENATGRFVVIELVQERLEHS